jgi:hypothetical protein
MTKQVQIALIGIFVFIFAGVAFSVEPTSPVVVARLHLRNITETIPTTTLFTPKFSGVFRVSTYAAVTTPVDSQMNWVLLWNWTDNAGAESIGLGSAPTTATPPQDYFFDFYSGAIASPFTFEAIAGQPVSFSLVKPSGLTGGACGLAIIVERLE